MEYSTEQLKLLYACMDYTSLGGTDSDRSVGMLAQQILEEYERSGWYPAAFCTWPNLVPAIKGLLASTPVKIAAVSGAFAGGQSFFRIKLDETRMALDAGADEIDFVINRGRFLSGDSTYTAEEIQSAKELCGEGLLKVILETGELQSPENIRRASVIAIKSGADFVKTSTGKSAVSATPEAVREMCMAVKAHFVRSELKVGIKPSGGIADLDTAFSYMQLVEQQTTREWIQPRYFRIGASRLAAEILAAAPERVTQS